MTTSPIQPGDQIAVLDHGFVRLIDHMGSDRRIVEAARVSYRSPSKGDEGDKKLLSYLLRHKHTSPFEMGKVTFNIKMPIFVMRQYIRHRMQNVNEVSARYTELPEEFYIPESWRKQDPKNKQGSIETGNWNPDLRGGLCEAHVHGLWYNGTATGLLEEVNTVCYQAYQKLLEAGVAKEMARFVLPVNIYTEIYSTWDLNNLLKFFALRDDPHAQWEHQQFALAMKQITAQLFPWTMELYEQIRSEKAAKT